MARRARRTRGDGGRGRERDAALALRNAGLSAGGLPATVCPAAGATALHMLAAVTGVAYLVAAVLAWSVQVRADPADGDTGAQPAPRMAALPAANAVSVFCLNVPEVAIPLVLVPQVHASPVWSGPTFVINTVLVVTGQVPVTVLVSRFPGGGCRPSPGW